MQIPAGVPNHPTQSAKALKQAKLAQKAMTPPHMAKMTAMRDARAAQAQSNLAVAPNGAKNEGTARLPRSYVIVISSYENVARNSELTADAAEQLGKTIENRLKELNKNALRDIQDLPEYKNLEVNNIKELGEEISDMLTDEESSAKAFALLKNPVFANLMESTEQVHRSFAEMMQDNGDEKLLFGALQTDTLMNNPKASALHLKV